MGAFKELELEAELETDLFAIKNLEYPFQGEAPCGFPSPANDYLETQVNLHDYLIKKPAATFLMRAQGDSMIGAGIYNEDLLIIDRSIQARPNHVIVASIQGEFTIKRFIQKNGRTFLYPENSKYKPTEIFPEMDFQIFGVVTFNVHKVL